MRVIQYIFIHGAMQVIVRISYPTIPTTWVVEEMQLQHHAERALPCLTLLPMKSTVEDTVITHCVIRYSSLLPHGLVSELPAHDRCSGC